MFKNWKCKLLGHKCDETTTDSGYYICHRCYAHTYFDDEKYDLRCYYWTLRILWWLRGGYVEWGWQREMRAWNKSDNPF